MSQLGNLLKKLRTTQGLPNPRGIDLIEGLINDPSFITLCKVNDLVAKSQVLDQPEGDACRVIHEVN